jgi:hypothetical protein
MTKQSRLAVKKMTKKRLVCHHSNTGLSGFRMLTVGIKHGFTNPIGQLLENC